MLREMALAVAPPDILDILQLDDLLTKDMPERFQRGQRLGFDVRMRPVRRLGGDLADTQSGRTLRKGSEVDAYRLALLREDPEGWTRPTTQAAGDDALTRTSVYAAWLGERLDGVATVETTDCHLAHFRRSKTRRNGAKPSEGPDATLHGDLVIRDPARFRGALRSGIGRHKAYGYGMLILRPPGTPPQSG